MLPLSRETTQAVRVFINSVLLAECETVLFRYPIFLPSFTTFFIYTREGVPRPLRVLEGALRPLEGWSDSSWQCEHPPIWVLILFYSTRRQRVHPRAPHRVNRARTFFSDFPGLPLLAKGRW